MDLHFKYLDTDNLSLELKRALSMAQFWIKTYLVTVNDRHAQLLKVIHIDYTDAQLMKLDKAIRLLKKGKDALNSWSTNVQTLIGDAFDLISKYTESRFKIMSIQERMKNDSIGLKPDLVVLMKRSQSYRRTF